MAEKEVQVSEQTMIEKTVRQPPRFLALMKHMQQRESWDGFIEIER